MSDLYINKRELNIPQLPLSLQNKLAQIKVEGTPPLMIRDLSGKITYWNPSAENRYGWSATDAVGNVSHLLLNTVFPQPLDLINYELIQRGAWKGVLIHTLSDGSRVKVSSKWELYRDSEGSLCAVIEINDNFLNLVPSSAHLAHTSDIWWQKLFVMMLANKAYWITPFILLLAVFISLMLLRPQEGDLPSQELPTNEKNVSSIHNI